MKTPRTVPIADHLWEAIGRMAEEMGSDREALVNQALHVYARLHGYAIPGTSAGPPRLEFATEPQRRATVERVIAVADRLEKTLDGPVLPRLPEPGGLALLREDGSRVDVRGPRFVIGRGKGCDLVLESAKVSREHAVILAEQDGHVIEDLGSSNGTWFRGERIARRRIEHGDEFYVSAERLVCLLG
jgi:hypothetical protein